MRSCMAESSQKGGETLISSLERKHKMGIKRKGIEEWCGPGGRRLGLGGRGATESVFHKHKKLSRKEEAPPWIYPVRGWRKLHKGKEG